MNPNSSTTTDTCTAHAVCAAGYFVKIAGTTTPEPDCQPCDLGPFKAAESASSTITDTCTANAVCTAGYFIKIAGTTTPEPDCHPPHLCIQAGKLRSYHHFGFVFSLNVLG